MCIREVWRLPGVTQRLSNGASVTLACAPCQVQLCGVRAGWAVRADRCSRACGQNASFSSQPRSAQRVSRAAASPSLLQAPSFSWGLLCLLCGSNQRPKCRSRKRKVTAAHALVAQSPTFSSSEPCSYCCEWHSCASFSLSLTAVPAGARAVRRQSRGELRPSQRPCSDTSAPWGQTRFACSPISMTPHLASHSPCYNTLHSYYLI